MEKLPFDYTIISHPRRKRIAISVTPEGKVIIRTPPRTARKRIEKMLEENAGWVMESLSRVQVSDRKKWRWEPGGVMPLLGQEMTVALAADGKPGIYDGKIALTGNCPEDWVRCGKALYRQIAGEYMQKLVSELEPLVGVRAAGVNIGNARRSWGCCRKDGVIRFSWRLVGMQPEFCRYVAVHELCHLLHFNHSAAFWEEVARVMPEWKEVRKLCEKGTLPG